MPRRQEHRENLLSVHVGKVVVEQQHVVHRAVQACETFLAGAGDLQHEFGSVLGEIRGGEIDVEGVVFRVQHPHALAGFNRHWWAGKEVRWSAASTT